MFLSWQLVCHPEQGQVGFVKLLPNAEHQAYEIVYVIGEETLWGHGFGEQAVRAALSKAFLQLRAERVIAKVMPHRISALFAALEPADSSRRQKAID